MKKIILAFLVFLSFVSYAEDVKSNDNITETFVLSCLERNKVERGDAKANLNFSSFCLPYIAGSLNAISVIAKSEGWGSTCNISLFESPPVKDFLIQILVNNPQEIDSLMSTPSTILIRVASETIYKCKFDTRQKS